MRHMYIARGRGGCPDSTRGYFPFRITHDRGRGTYADCYIILRLGLKQRSAKRLAAEIYSRCRRQKLAAEVISKGSSRR
jgi:hypothetical protein